MNISTETQIYKLFLQKDYWTSRELSDYLEIEIEKIEKYLKDYRYSLGVRESMALSLDDSVLYKRADVGFWRDILTAWRNYCTIRYGEF